MTDFEIINLVNGGARIYEYRSSILPKQEPIRSFEITKDQFDLIKMEINKFMHPDPCGETDCTECTVGGCPAAPDQIKEG
jgi:hypothetical protein